MSAIRRNLPLLLAGTLLACSTSREVEVEPRLAPVEEGERAQVTAVPMRVAVLPPLLPPPPVFIDAAGRPVADKKPPKIPRTKATFTKRYEETYPSLSHFVSTLPAALKEVGFDVVNVKSRQEAKQQGAAVVLEPLVPEVEGFRRAAGGGLLLEGTVYDVHVHYRAQMSTMSGQILGVVSGHGESSTNFFFDDPYLQTAIVGGGSLVVMLLTAAAAAVPLLLAVGSQTELVWSNQDPLGGGPRLRGPQFALTSCTDSVNQQSAREGAPDVPGGAANVCARMLWIIAAVGVATAVVGVASVALVLAKFIGERAFNTVTGAVKSFASEPVWRGMLQSAHDKAARSIAESAAAASGRVQAPRPSRPAGGAR